MREEAVVSISLVGLVLSLACSSVTGAVAHAHTGTQTERWVLLPRRAKERQGRGMDLEELADRVHIQVRHVLIINAFNRVAHAYASCTSCCTPGSQRLVFDRCVRDFALVFGHLFCVQTDRITSCSLCLWPEKDTPAVTTPHAFLCLLIHTRLTSIPLDNLCRIHSSRDTHVVSTIECLL